MDPGAVASGKIPLVSVALEIEANSLTHTAAKLRKQYERIPYGSPLYWWETNCRGNVECAYIGQTIDMRLQKRFEGHAKLVRLLCKYVNDPNVSVHYRLCSRFDIIYSTGSKYHHCALEHLPIDQAKKVTDDIEAHLIFLKKPPFNTQHKSKKRKPWKHFKIRELRMK